MRIISSRLSIPLLLGAWLAGAPLLAAEKPAAVQPKAPQTQKVVKEGLSIELSVKPVDGTDRPVLEGDFARVRLEVKDNLSGAPVSKIYPGAWMDREGNAMGEPETADCKKKVESFIGGSILSRPELDLNVYYVLSLNEDATISVVDPLFGYGTSKLLTMVFLKSPGEDWALTPDSNRLFVSMPDSDRVAVVESTDWKVVYEIETPAKPRRLGLQPDGQYLWVAYDGSQGVPSGVRVVDTRSLRKVADIPTGQGAHDIAFSDDSRFAFVTNETDGTVSVIDVARLAEVRDVPVGARPTSIAWSTQARAAYVVATGAGRIAAVDAEKAEPRAVVAAEPGIGRIRFAPGGRLAFVVHPEKNTVHIIDAASNRLIQTADMEAGPDQVTFSDELAYVRHKGSETVLMIPLKTVGEEGRPVAVVDFPGGEHPPGRMARPTPADGIVQAPGATAVLVANPEDKVIYYYKEGMAAPMGHFQNYGKVPRAALVVDRSLREVQPGVYETVAQMSRAGRYDLALWVDSPRLIHCFPLELAENPKLAAARRPALGVEMRMEKTTVAAGQETAVRFRLSDSQSGAAKTGLEDVRVLTFLSPGIWQQRHWAQHVGDGLYEIRFTPPEEGLYYVFVEVASQGLALQKSPFLVLTAEKAVAQEAAAH
jgi:YVTN family beta-propeller protein